VTSSDSANVPGATSLAAAASQAAVEASRAATLAWQGKKPPPNSESKKLRNASPTSSRAGSLDVTIKRPSISDSSFLLDAPLIDFSASVMGSSAPAVKEFPTWWPLSPAPTPPPQPQPLQSSYVEAQPVSRRNQPRPPSRSLGRSNAHTRTSKPSKSEPLPPHPRSPSAPDLTNTVQEITDGPPISVSISEDISPEEELSREEKALKELKGVDENLAKAILNEIVVKGDEVQWDDIGRSFTKLSVILMCSRS
jgi:hypothetical protein